MNRRELLLGSLAAATAVGLRHRAVRAVQGDARPVRVGLVGLGNRGTYLLSTLLQLPGVKVPAVCDLSEKNAGRAADIVQKALGATPEIYSQSQNAYEKMLERDDLDSVLVATPTKWHCRMAVAAMKAGKHVASEVPAGFEIDELWELVKTKEQTGKRYMLLENYLYMQDILMVWNMIQQGLLGDPYYAECAYLHDCRFMLFKQDGSLDWWGEWASKFYGHDYPTHAMGPVSKWMGLNEGDRMTYCSAMMSRPRVLKEYAVKKYGADSPQGKIQWANGDFTSVMIETAQGRLIRNDYDVNSPRPMSIYYVLQGTRGVFDSRAGFYFEGKEEKWEPKDDFLARYEHPYWRELGKQAAKTGHGGGDYFVLHDFVEMVRQDREPWIDVYDAASWSSIFHCSRLSIDKQGGSVEMPDFTAGRWKNPDWRKDHLKPA